MVNARLPLMAVLALAACGFDLPEEALIEGPRVLAVRVVPQGTDDLRPFAALSTGDPASVETLIVDEDGPVAPDSMSARWVACRHGSRYASCVGCVDETKRRLLQHDRTGQPVQSAAAWH